MRRFAQVAPAACLSALAGATLAFDTRQYDNVPADIRAWFKGVIAPNGVPCCDISDGHRTEYDFRGGACWVRGTRARHHPRLRQPGRRSRMCITAAAS